MIPPDSAQSNAASVDSSRYGAQSPNLDQLLKDFVSGFDDLRQKNRDLQETRSRLLAELEQSHDRNRVAEECKAQLAIELGRATQQNRDLEVNCEKLGATLQETNTRVETLQEENSLLAASLEDTHRKAEGVQEDKARLEADLQESITKADGLLEENTRLSAALRETNSKVEALQEGNCQLESDLQRLITRADLLQEDNSRLSATLQDANRRNDGLQGENARLAATLQETSGQVEGLQEDNARLAATLEETRLKAEGLKEDNARLAADLAESGSKVVELREDNADLTNRLHETSGRAELLQADNSRLAADLQEAGRKASVLQEDNLWLSATLQEASKRTEELQRDKARLAAELQQLKDKIATVQQSSSSNSELTRFAVTTAARMLGRAAEAVESMEKAVKAEDAARFEMAKKRAVGLQAEAILLLDKARGEALARIHETDQKAVEVLRRTRDSILFMAENVERLPSGMMPIAGSPAPMGSPIDTARPASRGEELWAAPAAAVPPAQTDKPLPGVSDRPSESQAGNGLESALRDLQERLVRLRDTSPAFVDDGALQSANGARLSQSAATVAAPDNDILDQGPSQVEEPRREQADVELVDRKPVGPEPGEDDAAVPGPNGQGASGHAETSIGENLADSIVLEVSPFNSFAALSAFVQSLKNLPNVVEARVLGFEKSTLSVSMRYSSPMPPLGALLELPQFNLRLVSVKDDRIGLVVLDSES